MVGNVAAVRIYGRITKVRIKQLAAATLADAYASETS